MLSPMPEAVASFGGAVAGDYLYIYGGHVGETHEHSIENLSHHFRRLDLRSEGSTWEDLGEVQGLQGIPLVAHGDRVCRVGGLTARNSQGDEEDLISIAEVACYEPGEERWVELPPLPSGRSSHDAVVMGDTLYVVGGWQLRGAEQEPVWHDEMVMLDLSAEELQWVARPQGFQRRALAAAAAGGKVYALGGLSSDGTSRRVDVFDTATGTWNPGPQLPDMGGRMRGFGVSAFGVDDHVFLSGANGRIHVLEPGSETWRQDLGQLQQPRFFHRLLPHGDRLLFVGGASREGHLASVESQSLTALLAAKGEAGPARDVEEPAADGMEAEAEMEAEKETASWPGFRGAGDGVVRSEAMPMEWSPEHNVAWRASLPGYGQSSPVVWGQQVFVTSVEGEEKESLILSALDRGTGEVRWRRLFDASQRIPSSNMVSKGAPTPVVDGEGVYAFWESGDVVALDHRGETRWQRSLTREHGEFEGNHGVGSSLVQTDEAVIVQVTHEGPSYFLALDKGTGETRWMAERPSKVAWTTPVVVSAADRNLLVSSAAGRVEALDAATGERLWQVEGIEKNHVPSVVVAGDLVVAASSEAGQSLALRPVAAGGPGKAEVLWHAEGVSSGFGSPLVMGDCVLFVNKSGVAHCVDRQDGHLRWRHRLGAACWASPIAAGDYAFFFTKEGTTAVLKPTAEGPGPVAENSLPTDDTVYGVAAIPGAFFVRTGSEILRIGLDTPSAPEPSGDAVVARREP
ncbi:MAG: PQQ-binding-like beta-propeller repeat protein [Acidobacteriota bacterium]|nr:PQQ-binding-like beta-propeller repeat protein [Acidobacteriota bacterium]